MARGNGGKAFDTHFQTPFVVSALAYNAFVAR